MVDYWQDPSEFFRAIGLTARLNRIRERPTTEYGQLLGRLVTGADPDVDAAFAAIERVLISQPEQIARLNRIRKRATTEYGELRRALADWVSRDILANTILSDPALNDGQRQRRALNVYRTGDPELLDGGRPKEKPQQMIVGDFRKLISGELVGPWLGTYGQDDDGHARPLDAGEAITVLTQQYGFANKHACLAYLWCARRQLGLNAEQLPLPGNPKDYGDEEED